MQMLDCLTYNLQQNQHLQGDLETLFSSLGWSGGGYGISPDATLDSARRGAATVTCEVVDEKYGVPLQLSVVIDVNTLVDRVCTAQPHLQPQQAADYVCALFKEKLVLKKRAEALLYQQKARASEQLWISTSWHPFVVYSFLPRSMQVLLDLWVWRLRKPHPTPGQIDLLLDVMGLEGMEPTDQQVALRMAICEEDYFRAQALCAFFHDDPTFNDYFMGHAKPLIFSETFDAFSVFPSTEDLPLTYLDVDVDPLPPTPPMFMGVKSEVSLRNDLTREGMGETLRLLEAQDIPTEEAFLWGRRGRFA